MKPDVISKLSSLNTLLSIVAGSGPECLKEIQAAIDFRKDYCKNRLCTWDLSNSAKHLANIHLQGKQNHKVLHWHVQAPFLGVLWLHSMLNEKLKDAPTLNEPLFLITGLRAAIKAQGKKWTSRQARLYEESVRLTEDTLIAGLAHLKHFQIICC